MYGNGQRGALFALGYSLRPLSLLYPKSHGRATCTPVDYSPLSGMDELAVYALNLLPRI